MQPRITQKNNKAGVCYAITDEGVELPVIDVTHPAFAIQLTDFRAGYASSKIHQGNEKSGKNTGVCSTPVVQLYATTFHPIARRHRLGRYVHDRHAHLSHEARRR